MKVMYRQKGFAPIFTVIGLLIVLLGMGVALSVLRSKFTIINRPQPLPSQSPVACTADAKQCPNGSYVSRQGPKCEFAACPSPKADSMTNWKTYTNEKLGVSIKIPPTWSVEDSGDLTEAPVLSGSDSAQHRRAMVQIDRLKAPNDKTAKDYYERSNKGNTLREIIRAKEVSVADTTGYDVTNKVLTNGGAPFNREVTILHNGYAYVIGFDESVNSDNWQDSFAQIHSPNDWKLNSLFDQILSTFKFLDQSESQDKRCGYLGPPGTDTSCPNGYTCKIADPSNDAGGVCVKQTQPELNGTITEKDNGKTFSYVDTERFSVDLDPVKYPLNKLTCKPEGVIGYVSNLSVNGPENYPIGFQVDAPGKSCILRNGDFSVTIKVKS